MKRRQIFQFSPIARRISIGVVIISILAVLGYLFASNYFTPEKMAHRELEKIAKDYYENFYYDSLVANIPSDQKTEKFKIYAETGLPRVRLRELLLYDDEKHAASTKYFNYNGYTCDQDRTSITIYPTEPYGTADYRIEYNYVCE